ncbi:hypothetical protein TRFO_17782 [Tritrichomonas foetus]|uniref:E2F/DP family winged-helix DNA-binding domain-containing protein n=1 Tax=Tritrichomonas foetus TaxID=1144522 RepID=A0A1J4KSF7_9EUKA|nr:hypothetical protein TRFO_17782 [Tritrichomonas foetus]|eukprot:OHT12405.1 hypothetical protein TRFO_17782 [Tritrichomonas foetus]
MFLNSQEANMFEPQCDKIAPPKPASNNSQSITIIFKSIIQKYEKTRSHNINIMNVARKYNLQHRRVYDLFNLLTSLHVCKNVERGKISWVSMNEAMKTISYEYTKIECDSLTKPMTSLFDLSSSPSLGQIALKFLSLYIYLDVQTLPLKSVLALFHNARCDIKSLERRVYLVLGMPEIMEILTHTKRTGDYTITFDFQPIRERAMKKKFVIASQSMPASVEGLLSKFDMCYMNSVSHDRREKFYNIC